MKTEILIAVLILFTASTAAFTADLEKTQESRQEVDFDLEIENTGPENRSYSLFVLSPRSQWFYYPQSLQVDAGQRENADIRVTIPENEVQSTYGFQVKIRESGSSEQKTVENSFRVTQPYRVNIISLEKSRDTLKPGESVNTTIEIKNLDNRQLTDYSVKAEYMGENFSRKGTEILPGGTRRFKFNFLAPRNASPSTETVVYRAQVEGNVERTAKHSFEIIEVINISKTVEEENKLIWATKTVSARNDGNTNQNASAQLEIPGYLTPITEPGQEAEVTQTNSSTIYTWNQELQPGESFSRSIKTSYWIPIALIILLAAALTAIKKIGQPLKITKKAEKQDGKIKIEIEVRNTGNTEISELTVEEFIPDIATVDPEFEMNTPETRQTNEGTQIKWTIEDLQPSDQRIIQYRIKPKVNVEEEVELGPAVLKEDGEKVAESNSVQVEFTP